MHNHPPKIDRRLCRRDTLLSRRHPQSPVRLAAPRLPCSCCCCRLRRPRSQTAQVPAQRALPRCPPAARALIHPRHSRGTRQRRRKRRRPRGTRPPRPRQPPRTTAPHPEGVPAEPAAESAGRTICSPQGSLPRLNQHNVENLGIRHGHSSCDNAIFRIVRRHCNNRTGEIR